MSSQSSLSHRSPSLRRIQADIRELALDPSDRYHAAPLEHDMLEWHFSIRGADGTDFEGGLYHGRILLPPDYPFKPPHILFLTPSGRFETHTKICLSFSAYHPELWQPAWGIRLILEALISFLPTKADGAIGALDWSSAERKALAVKSIDFCCPTCQCCVRDLLSKLQSIGQKKNASNNGASSTTTTAKVSNGGGRFQKEIEELQRLQFLEHPKIEDESIANDKSIAAAKNEEKGDQVMQEDQIEKEVQEGEKRAAVEEDEANEQQDDDLKAQQGQGGDDGVDVKEKEDETVAGTEVSQQQRHEHGEVSIVPQQQQQQPRDLEPARDIAPPLAAPAPRQPADAPDDDDTNNTNNNAGGIVPAAEHGNAAADVANNNNDVKRFVITPHLDPILHAMIVVLAALCYLLLRKILALLTELRELQQEQ